MRIGLVTTWFDRGASYVSRAYKDVLEQQGASVEVYVRGGERYGRKDPYWDLPEVTWGPRLGGIRISYRHFFRWLWHKKIDVLLFNEERDFLLVEECTRYGYPCVAYIDYYTKKSAPRHGAFDALICNTRRHYGVFEWHPQCYYIPWGVNDSEFIPKKGIPRPNSTVVFFHNAGMLGINMRKGTDLVLDAFSGIDGDCNLVIHGQLLYERLPLLLRRKIETNSKVKYIGADVKPPGLYHMGDVYVYPSRLDGIGLTIVEAMACGLPVITTDAAPMNEFVEDGVTGDLVPIRSSRMRADGYYWPEVEVDVAALTSKMRAYVDEPELSMTRGLAARRDVEQRWEWRRNSGAVMQVLRDAQARGSVGRRKPSVGSFCIWESRTQLWRLRRFGSLALRRIGNSVTSSATAGSGHR